MPAVEPTRAADRIARKAGQARNALVSPGVWRALQLHDQLVVLLTLHLQIEIAPTTTGPRSHGPVLVAMGQRLRPVLALLQLVTLQVSSRCCQPACWRQSRDVQAGVLIPVQRRRRSS